MTTEYATRSTISSAHSRRASGGRRVLIAGHRSETNSSLRKAFLNRGLDARVVSPLALTGRAGDVILNRVDIARSLRGPEPGFWAVKRQQGRGVLMLNRPAALLTAHDKLATALLLGAAGLRHPRTAHVSALAAPRTIEPPYVVKPRFGSWGQDVYRCESEDDLVECLTRLHTRPWFRRQGVLVQELLPPVGRDLRLVVAAGTIVGAVERVALPGEWRTNVELGAVRVPATPTHEAAALALGAVSAVGLDLAGVDLMFDADGHPVVLEINGAVDFTVDYGPEVFAEAAEALLAPSALLAAPPPRRPRAAPIGAAFAM